MNRIQYFDSVFQSQLRQQEFWQMFKKENPSWNARFDQQTRLPYRAWGKGISFDVSDPYILEQELRKWIDAQEVFGLKSSSLQPIKIASSKAL